MVRGFLLNVRPLDLVVAGIFLVVHGVFLLVFFAADEATRRCAHYAAYHGAVGPVVGGFLASASFSE